VFRTNLASADLITVTIGNNDLAPCDFTPATDDACEAAIRQLEVNLKATLFVIKKLRHGRRTALRVTDYFNSAIGDPAAPPGEAFQQDFAEKLGEQNAAICSAASAAGAVCVDLIRPFNGPSGSEPANPFLMSDHTHPNAEGQGKIAKAIAAVGFAPIRRDGLSRALRVRPTRSGTTMLLPGMRSALGGSPWALPSGAALFGAEAARLAGGASTPPGLPWAAPAVPGGVNPLGVGIDRATHTIYVANGDNTVSVVNGATCNAMHSSGCSETPPTVPIGSGAIGLAVDQSTNTIYVANSGDNTVSVINGATCNATDTLGCDQTPPTVAVGNFPIVLAIDEATGTVYVTNGGDNTVSVIDGRTCNGTVTSGCNQTPATVTVGSGPGGVAVDQATDSVYVANGGDNTVSVIDGATCNSSTSSGCGQTPPTVAANLLPGVLAIDHASHTVYVTGGTLGDSIGSVALINAATCNAIVTSGCGQTPSTAPVGSSPGWVAVNPATHSIYVVNQADSSVSVLNSLTCNATVTSGCVEAPPAMAIGFVGGGVDVDVATDTIYASSQTANTVSVLNGARCNASHTSGCTQFAPTTAVGFHPQGVATNRATHTIYVADRDGTVSVINAAACNANRGSGCGQAWATVSVGDSPQGVAVNRATDTIYTANGFNREKTVSVIDGRTCNAADTSGCGQTPATATAGTGAFAVAVNQATETIYVANRNDNTVSVIDGRACNGSNTAGCGQDWATVAVGASPQALAIDKTTDTIYVTNTGDDTVSVINGATCNGSDISGCDQTPPTVAVGTGPRAVAVNPATDTIYVGNGFDGTVSVVDGRRCKGTESSGCGQTPAAVAIGSFSDTGVAVGRSMAVDQATDTVYLTSVFDSDVVAIDGAACRAGHTNGCRAKVLKLRAGGFPINIALDKAAGTLFVTDNVDSNVSLFHSRR
jgi:YVTN family beta-propeller protein